MEAALGMLGPVLQVGLAAAMLWRRVAGRFRFFFAYTIYSIVAIGVNLRLKGNAEAFFVSYSVSEMVYGALAMLAIREAFQDILKAYYRRYPWARWLPPIFVLSLIVLPAWRCLYHPHILGGALNTCVMSGSYTFGFCVRSLEVLILLIYLAARRRYRLRRYPAGIIVGFGVYAAISLVSYLLRSQFGPGFESWYHNLAPGAYFSAALSWLITFLGLEPRLEKQRLDEGQVRKAGAAMEEALDELERKSGRKRR